MSIPSIASWPFLGYISSQISSTELEIFYKEAINTPIPPSDPSGCHHPPSILCKANTKRHAMDNSPLDRLPPEIRNMIYEMALPWEQVELPWCDCLKSLKMVYPRQYPLALLSTCRQIRAESRLLVYTNVELFLDFDLGYGGEGCEYALDTSLSTA
jgi:hypothetical protein